MSARPTTKHWITICIMSFCIIGIAVLMNHDRRHLAGSAPGEFAQQFSVETETRNGVETKKTYHLNYSFEVDGKQYQGSDTLKTEPTSADCTVYFDPNRPEINALTENPINTTVTGSIIALAVVAFLAFFWLPVGQKRNVPEMTAPVAGGVGDSAGEYLTMNHGQFDANGYVMLAFFGQIILMSWAGISVAQAITAGRINADIVAIDACMVALIYTFWIYWDRWRCIAAHGSRYTSGCANISIFYLPIVVCFYANYRGFLKLKGQ